MHARTCQMSSWALCMAFCSRVLSSRFPGYFGVVVWSQTSSVLGHVTSLRWIRCGPRKSLAFAIKPHAEKKLEVTLKLMLGGSHLTSFMTQLIQFVDVCDTSARPKDLVLNSCLHEAVTRTQTLRKQNELLCNECFLPITGMTYIELLSCSLFVSFHVPCMEYPYCGNLFF
jgi:hypothetical protein